jgi:hypothetical protein
MMQLIAHEPALLKERFLIEWFDEEVYKKKQMLDNLNSVVVVNTAALSLLDPTIDDTVLNNYQY